MVRPSVLQKQDTAGKESKHSTSQKAVPTALLVRSIPEPTTKTSLVLGGCHASHIVSLHPKSSLSVLLTSVRQDLPEHSMPMAAMMKPCPVPTQTHPVPQEFRYSRDLFISDEPECLLLVGTEWLLVPRVTQLLRLNLSLVPFDSAAHSESGRAPPLDKEGFSSDSQLPKSQCRIPLFTNQGTSLMMLLRGGRSYI